MERLYKPNEVAKILNVTVKTIQNWDKEGKIKVERSPSNRRMIPQSEVDRLLNRDSKSKETQSIAVYARVYDYSQKEELDRQVGQLIGKIDTKKNTIRVITDIASGAEEERKGLMELNKLVESESISKIYITYKDRLASVGYSYLELYYKNHGVEIEVIEKEKSEMEKKEILQECKSVYRKLSELLDKEQQKELEEEWKNLI